MYREKGGANMLRTLSLFEKYKNNIDNVGRKRRYSRNILQWSKNDFKSKKPPMETTNGVWSTRSLIKIHNTPPDIHVLSYFRAHAGSAVLNFEDKDLIIVAGGSSNNFELLSSFETFDGSKWNEVGKLCKSFLKKNMSSSCPLR